MNDVIAALKKITIKQKKYMHHTDIMLRTENADSDNWIHSKVVTNAAKKLQKLP